MNACSAGLPWAAWVASDGVGSRGSASSADAAATGLEAALSAFRDVAAALPTSAVEVVKSA